MNVLKEKMRQMLEEGRLSPEQYRELHAVLCPESLVSPPPTASVPTPRPLPSTTPAALSPGRPGSVLACAIFLFIAAVDQMSSLSFYGSGLGNALVTISAVGLGIGLLKMQRWAYLILFPFALLAPLVCLFQANAVGFLFNAAYLVLMLYAWPAFYPGRSVAEVWRAIQEKYRKAQPNDSTSPLPVPVLALAILMAIVAFLNMTGPFMAMSLGNFFTQYAGLNQLTSLHVIILRFVYQHFISMTPLQGMMAAAVSAALAYGIFRRNRLVFIALTVVTAIGLFSRMAPGGGIILLYVIRVMLIVKSWRFFFPSGAIQL